MLPTRALLRLSVGECFGVKTGERRFIGLAQVFCALVSISAILARSRASSSVKAAVAALGAGGG